MLKLNYIITNPFKYKYMRISVATNNLYKDTFSLCDVNKHHGCSTYDEFIDFVAILDSVKDINNDDTLEEVKMNPKLSELILAHFDDDAVITHVEDL